MAPVINKATNILRFPLQLFPFLMISNRFFLDSIIIGPTQWLLWKVVFQTAALWIRFQEEGIDPATRIRTFANSIYEQFAANASLVIHTGERIKREILVYGTRRRGLIRQHRHFGLSSHIHAFMPLSRGKDFPSFLESPTFRKRIKWWKGRLDQQKVALNGPRQVSRPKEKTASFAAKTIHAFTGMIISAEVLTSQHKY